MNIKIRGRTRNAAIIKNPILLKEFIISAFESSEMPDQRALWHTVYTLQYFFDLLRI